MTGSSHERPGRSVRTMRNARALPTGTAIAVIPNARIRLVQTARWKSSSAKTNLNAEKESFADGWKNGASRTAW